MTKPANDESPAGSKWIEQQRAIAQIDRQIADLYARRANVLEQLVNVNVERVSGRRGATVQPMEAGLLTLKEASTLMHTPAETIRYWIYQGRLAKVKPGRLVMVRETELRALLEGKR